MFSRLVVLISALTLAGCMSAPPKTFKAVGLVNGNAYEIQVIRNGPVPGNSASVLINGNEVLNTNRKTIITSNPNCTRLSVYAYRCEDKGTFQNKTVTVVEEWSASIYSKYSYFDVLIDDKLVQRVVGN